MNEPPGLPSALGIEAVEWFAQEGGAENLTVRITGRWRRRRPAWSGQPMLVVEVHGYRHRYPAMPEPPSLTGTAPGTWRMSFSVPAWLAPHLGMRASLQLGGVVIALPAQLSGAASGSAAAVSEEDVLEERRLQSPELALEAARRRGREAEEAAAELSGQVRRLTRELEQARDEPGRLRALLADRERALREAEQRAHSEQRVREEVQDELAARLREREDSDGPLAELAAAEHRVVELVSELRALRRRLDEAEHHAAAAGAARDRTRRRGLERAVTHGIRTELSLAIRTPPAPPGVLPVVGVAPGRGLALERQMIDSRSAPRVIETVPEELTSTLAALRGELDKLRSIAEREREARAQALARVSSLERELHEYATRCERAYDAIEQLRRRLGHVPIAGGAPAPLAPAAPAAVEADRLDAALSRLRQAAPAPDPEPVEEPALPVIAARPWLGEVLRSLVERDPATAGRLVLALLPAQRLVHAQPLAYDLVLADAGCVQVTTAGAYWTVERHESPRPPDATQFRVLGDFAGLARLASAKRVRRFCRRGAARISGDRHAAQALPALIRTPLSISQLLSAGVRIEPGLTLQVVAAMVDPGWTRGERFAIAFVEPAAVSSDERIHHLVVSDGARLETGEGMPSDSIDTRIVCQPDLLLALLDGQSVSDAEVGPDTRPLTILQSWVKRAQSG